MSNGERTEKSMDLSDIDLDVLDQLLSEEGVDAARDTARDAHAIQPRSVGARVPLSFSQEMLYLLDQASPGLTAYNLGLAKRLVGNLDVAALQRAVSALAARHEVLRTRFGVVDGEPSQIVDAPAPVPVTVVDISNRAGSDQDAELARMLGERARTPFSLATDHLFRVLLVRLSPTDHVLVLETHHAIADGWSMGLMTREFSALYGAEHRGIAPELPALRIQFGDYAIWQRETLRGERLDNLLTYWRDQLVDAREPLGLPTDFPQPATPTFAGAQIAGFMSPHDLDRLKAFGREHDATLYMMLLAAYATVLHRYTGREQVLIGSGIANRNEQGTDTLIGYFNNTLVQRADFRGDPTVAELLTRVRDSALGAYDHQEVPLEKLILDLNEGDARMNDASLFQAVFTMQDNVGAVVQLDDLAVSSVSVELGATKFDITFLPSERDGGLRLTTHYRSDLFSAATMERFVGHLRQVLAEMTSDASRRISALALLTGDETRALAVWNDTAVDEGAAATIVELFERQASRVPERLAVVGRPSALDSAAAAETLSYAELNTRANQLAHRLRASGVSAGSPVGVALDRSTDAVVAMLGILKAGGCYVPLPPELPPARLTDQLAESGAKIVVSIAAHAGKLPSGPQLIAMDADAADLESRPVSNPVAAALADGLAYVLFTSGSTGTPKGVAVTHANVVHYARAVSRVLADVAHDTPDDGFAALDGLHFGLVSTFGADLGNTSLFPSLFAGGTLHVLPSAVTTEPERFAEYLAAHPIDVLKLTPSHLRALVAGASGAELEKLLPNRWLALGGEALSLDLAQSLVDAGKCRVLNHYGPTETTVGVLTFEATTASLAEVAALGAQTVPIGRPLANTQAFVVNMQGEQQPLAIPGELWIGGAGVTRGYLGRDDLTAERFTQFAGTHVYRTGDRARRLSNGAIEFLGRLDDQVKVRGYRVELGEIAQTLRAHPDVANAEVVLRRDNGEPQLVAYVVDGRPSYAASHGERISNETLIPWLSERLPEYMVPHVIMAVDEIPLTANGKVDRARLPAPHAVTADIVVAPRTETERKLATIWEDVLKKSEVGVTQNFLDLGGHSLLAIRILGKISRGFGIRLSLRTLFDAPTVEKLGELLDVELQLAAIDALTSDDKQ